MKDGTSLGSGSSRRCRPRWSPGGQRGDRGRFGRGRGCRVFQRRSGRSLVQQFDCQGEGQDREHNQQKDQAGNTFWAAAD